MSIYYLTGAGCAQKIVLQVLMNSAILDIARPVSEPFKPGE